MSAFDPQSVKEIFKPENESSGEDNGQVTIIGGSSLFHGAPIFSLKVASRIVDMVFFATPEKSVGHIAESIKSKLMSFVWIPWEEAEEYLKKSDAVLIGPGFLRFRGENSTEEERNLSCDEACQLTRQITKGFLSKFPGKKWVIDAGSLQTLDPEWIPEHSILTPNKREFKLLFGSLTPKEAAGKHNCILVLKGPTTLVVSKEKEIEVTNGNPGLTKGGTGDTLAGLAVALLAKNDPLLAASVASYITKAAADELYKRVGTYYNTDDLVEKIPQTLNSLL